MYYTTRYGPEKVPNYEKSVSVTFDSIFDLIKYTKEVPSQPRFGPDFSSREDGREDFTMCKTFEDAVELAQSGWVHGYNNLLESLKSLKIHSEAPNKFQPKNSVIGDLPNVPRAIIGLPDSMIYSNKIPTKTKVINVFADIGCNCGVKTETMVDKGAFIVGLIEKIERTGARTNLYATLSATSSEESLFVSTKIKDSREPLSIKRVAFPLIHPAMFRRLYFHVIEAATTKSGWTSGYGRTKSSIGISYIKNFYEHVLYIPSLNDLSFEKSNLDYYYEKVIKYNHDNFDIKSGL